MESNKATILENIKVYIKQKPINKNDSSTTTNDNNQSSIKSYKKNGKCNYYSLLNKKSYDFKFEGYLDTNIEQYDVYNTVAKPIVDSALQGYSGIYHQYIAYFCITALALLKLLYYNIHGFCKYAVIYVCMYVCM